MGKGGEVSLTREMILDILGTHFGEYQARFGVSRIGLFGSFARGEQTGGSDVDILVEFERPTYRGYMSLKTALEGLFQRDVDLVTDQALKPSIRDQILNEVIYAADRSTVP